MGPFRLFGYTWKHGRRTNETMTSDLDSREPSACGGGTCPQGLRKRSRAYRQSGRSGLGGYRSRLEPVSRRGFETREDSGIHPGIPASQRGRGVDENGISHRGIPQFRFFWETRPRRRRRLFRPGADIVRPLSENRRRRPRLFRTRRRSLFREGSRIHPPARQRPSGQNRRGRRRIRTDHERYEKEPRRTRTRPYGNVLLEVIRSPAFFQDFTASGVRGKPFRPAGRKPGFRFRHQRRGKTDARRREIPFGTPARSHAGRQSLRARLRRSRREVAFVGTRNLA